MSSQLADFLNEHNLSLESVVRESLVTEQLSSEDRAKYVARADARREKKSYSDVGVDKPTALRRGVSVRIVKLALEGQPITRVNRKKITRAVHNLLKGGTDVTVFKLFGDVRSRNHKKPSSDEE
ncbi:MAG: hypothetical protein KTR25_14315 [Myxococcales bacterium]|nr:hypothetical protein [Myxococcales bacterium]